MTRVPSATERAKRDAAIERFLAEARPLTPEERARVEELLTYPLSEDFK